MKSLKSDPIGESVYQYIVHYLQEYQLAPSLREIAANCYLGKSTVLRCLDRLEDKGLIVRTPGKARSIVIVHRHLPLFPKADQTVLKKQN